MSNVLKRQAPTNAEYKAEAERLSREMDLLFEKMEMTHAESERLKKECDVIGAHTDKILTELEQMVKSFSAAA